MSLSLLLTTAAWVFFALAACGAIYAVVAAWTLARFLAGPAPAQALDRSITLLKPLSGDEPELYENLASFCDQDYGGAVQIVLGAASADDPALAAARRLTQAFPERDILIAVDPTRHGANRKISNLINMMRHATGAVIVISDSDVRMPRYGLSRIAAALEVDGVGMIHCLYRGRAAGNFWSQLAALDIDLRYAAAVTVGQALGAHPCLGPTMALRRETLERIGGLAPLAERLADDFELGRAVTAAGLAVVMPKLVIDHVFPERTARAMWDHELRWARTTRLIEPAGYLGSGVTHILPLALIGAALAGFSPVALTLFLALAGVRLVQAVVLSALMASDPRNLWQTPLRDLISFGVFLASIAGGTVVWRGVRLKVSRTGQLLAAGYQ